MTSVERKKIDFIGAVDVGLSDGHGREEAGFLVAPK